MAVISQRETGTALCHTQRGSVPRQRMTLMLYALLALVASCFRVSAFRRPSIGVSSAEITCWTCGDKANNKDCNNWAPNLSCPFNRTVCQTVHRFSVSGKVSLAVTKNCVHVSSCTPQHVGCTQPDSAGQQECVSCCDYSYCNQDVPVNRTTALELSTFTATHTSHASRTSHPVSVSLELLLCVYTAILGCFQHAPWTSLPS